MDTASESFGTEDTYAEQLAEGSYSWYKRAAINSRRYHRASAVLVQIIAAAIPVAAVIAPKDATAPAILGAVIVIVSALRSTFNWQENYLRFSGAREAVEAERRRYRVQAAPYDDPRTKDQILVAAVTKIEQEEMAGWLRSVSEPPRQGSELRAEVQQTSTAST